MDKEYSWSNNANFKRPVPASAVAEEIGKIAKVKGRHGYAGVTPEDLLESAAPEDSPIHCLFQWDDSIAGHQYRLMQAQRVIRSIVIKHAENAPPVKAFVSVRTADVSSRNPIKDPDEKPPLRQFFGIDAVRRSASMRASVLEDMKRDIIAFQSRYSAHMKYFKLEASEEKLEEVKEEIDSRIIEQREAATAVYAN